MVHPASSLSTPVKGSKEALPANNQLVSLKSAGWVLARHILQFNKNLTLLKQEN